jgi:hypothetical protein
MSETSLDATSPVDQGTPLDELPPIDVAAPDKRVIDLSPTEFALLCDWNAREYGGYGGSLPCRIDASSPSIGAPIGVQDCLDTLEFRLWGRQCPLTVQDFMECVRWQVQKVCSPTDAGDWPPSCVTQQGPLCIGGIGKDSQAPAADAEAGASLDEAGEAAADDAASDSTASDSAASDSADGPTSGD